MEDKEGTPWKTIKSSANGLRKSTKRLYQRVKHEFRSNRKPKDTKVESIHITPEPEVADWVIHSACSSTRRSSAETGARDSSAGSSGETDTRVSSASSSTSRCSASSRGHDGVKIVHDMEDELPGQRGYCS